MKANYKNQYRKNGKVQFVYSVTGTDAELEQYAESKGDYLVNDEETGDPLWFSRDYIGESAELIFTSKGNVVADLGEFEKAASLASRFGGSLGAEIARAAVSKLMTGSSSAKSVSKVEAEETSEKIDA